MKYLIALALLIALLDPTRLYIVPARDTVMPGQLFSVTVTQFDSAEPIAFDAGGLEVVTDTLGLPTRYIWLRASGVPRDVRLRAWGATLSSEAVVRVCCMESAAPIDRARRIYVAVFRG